MNSDKNTSTDFYSNSCFAILLLVCARLFWPNLFLDFWNDELYTLKYFTFVPINVTLSDYHAPNNHIFFNLINNLYLKLIGVESLSELMQSPWKLRIIPMLYLVGSLFLIFNIGRKFFTPTIGLLAVLVFITTIPTFNFAFQIRGYGLSALLLLAVSHDILSYLQNPKKKYLLGLIITTAFLFYTVPSNLYPILGILLFLGIHFLFTVFNSKNQRSFHILKSSKSLVLIFTILIGLVLGILAYSNVFVDVFFNKWVKPGEPFTITLLQSYILPKVSQGFLSNRWPLLLILIIGFFLNYKYWKKWFHYTALFLSILIVPFLLVFIRGDVPPLRVFVNLIPFFSLFFAFGIAAAFELIPKIRKWNYLLFGLVIIFCTANFVVEKRAMKSQLYNFLEKGHRAQELYYQYYSAHYNPLDRAKEVSGIVQQDEQLVVIDGCEPHGIGLYLSAENVQYLYQPNIDSLLKLQTPMLLITRRPNAFLSKKECSPELINSAFNYHTLIKMNAEGSTTSNEF